MDGDQTTYLDHVRRYDKGPLTPQGLVRFELTLVGWGWMMCRWLLFAGLLLFSAGAHAQIRSELTVFGGIQFGGNVDLDGGDASLESGPSYGVIYGYRVRKNALMTFGYHRHQNTVRASVGEGVDAVNLSFGSASGFIQVGGEVELEDSRPFTPFLGFSVGVGHFLPEVEGAGTEWYFATILSGGVKIQLTDRWGIRTHARMLNTYLTGSRRWFCSSAVGNSGCLVTGDFNVVIQGDVGAGIYYQF